MEKREGLDTRTLLFFFLPLGFSASLVTLSHIIINSTLVRAENSEFIIASYAIAMSLFGITERLGVLLRQTCSSLVRDTYSFKLMSRFTLYLILSLTVVACLVAFTPVGDFIFAVIYGANPDMVAYIKQIYQVLIFVTIFSALRCLNQGIIIYNRQTKWLTIGMAIRLAAMYLLSLIFISTGHITGKTGAIIFLVGMMIEALVSYIEGRSLVRKMPERHKSRIESKKYIFKFYSPLMLSSVIIVMIGPAINIFLGKTGDIELAIASYAIALSVAQLFLSFFSYMHQIVINFYDDHEGEVKRFSLIIGFIPFSLLAIFCFTPIGAFFLENVMGVTGRLLDASLQVLMFFLLMALIFPFVDYFNGLLMIHKQTKVTIYSQSANLLMTLVVLVIAVQFASHWNGIIGALAQSMGILAELIVVSSIVMTKERKKGKLLPIIKGVGRVSSNR
ncbi:multi antimicrobial extrusion protein MatE [Metabacillus malikii]|uniref:O-antigen/teichoic acid export membrane protein n=1 Tax=Metabacillus malikii TaxID=1504265 RepID=A0ABT9ZCU4_9BACI|nr:multi antimicrobial extrusion protein MatE [Metabacillus malikii]MDQ0230083.1 O-antigen/teichoic acid export membrane protein [Metabacillus malikii]